MQNTTIIKDYSVILQKNLNAVHFSYLTNESTEVPNARLCSVLQKETELCTHFLVLYRYSGTEVVLNRPGYFCATTYTVA